MWVSPFRYPRLIGYLLLPVAFRSLSRLSSALSAKASTLCSFLLDHLLSFPIALGNAVLIDASIFRFIVNLFTMFSDVLIKFVFIVSV